MTASPLSRIQQHPWLCAAIAISLGVAAGAAQAILSTRLSALLAIGAVLGLGATVIMLRNPTWALYALAFAVPVERFGRITDDTAAFSISINRGLGMLAFLIACAHIALHRRRPFINTPLMLWSAFTVCGILTLFYTTDLIPGVKIASGYVGNILFLFTAMNLAIGDTLEETRRRCNTSILFWLAASMLVVFYSIYDWHLGSGQTGGIPLGDLDPQAGAQSAEYRWSTVWIDRAELETLGGLSIRRSMGSTSHAAVFGINLIMSIPFFLYFIRISKNRLLNAAMWIGLGATMYCVLLNNTRASLLLAVAAIGLCFFVGLIRLTPWMIGIGLAAAAAIPLFVPVDIFQRILDFQNYTTGKSQAMQIRLDYWSAGLRAISDHWLLGNGLANQRVVLDYLRNPIEGKSHMHNIYLQTALDVGIVAWFVFFAFIFSVAYVCIRTWRIARHYGAPIDAWFMTASVVLVACVLVFGLQVDVLYFPLKAFWLVIGLVFALTVHTRHLNRRSSPSAALETVKHD